ncbi:MAG TPA: DUF5312 family protein [Treponemataceae bacterium]|nr:DUF5312 family protein [Treponemataceae bacterium]HPS43824.1 DUF5312 family protein [Treponemataceae bacterium]
MSLDIDSIFQRVFGMFLSSSDPEVEKKRQLKALAKELTKSKYKWYRPSSQEALPGMGKFFYEIYKVIGAAQVILANANSSLVLKNLLVELSLSKRQVELKERLTEDAIKERAKTVAVKELATQVKDELAAFMSEFDTEKVKSIDALYSQLEMMVNFVSFDYFFLLKKFDSSIPERTFSYNPKYETIRGEYVLEDLKDFAAVAYALPLTADWPKIFTFVKAYREVEPVAIGQWNKLMNALAEIRRTGILERIIRHLGSDPTYVVTYDQVSDRIVDNYLMKMKTQTEMVVQQISQENRSSKASELLKQIFGTDSIVRLKNYAERANPPFEKKMLGGYLYVEELNFMKAFLIDYFKRDIRALTDLFLVRGKWTVSSMSAGYSGSFHALLELSDAITEFDDSLAEDGELGTKLHAMLARADRDKEVVKQLRTQLKDVNDRALRYLTDGTQHLIIIARNLKAILEDFEKTPRGLLSNWKELELNADRPIKEWVVDVYRQIFSFVSLMQLYLKGE